MCTTRDNELTAAVKKSFKNGKRKFYKIFAVNKVTGEITSPWQQTPVVFPVLSADYVSTTRIINHGIHVCLTQASANQSRYKMYYDRNYLFQDEKKKLVIVSVVGYLKDFVAAGVDSFTSKKNAAVLSKITISRRQIAKLRGHKWADMK